MKRQRYLWQFLWIFIVMQAAFIVNAGAQSIEDVLLVSSDAGNQEAGVALESVLEDIEKRYDVTFLYEEYVVAGKYVMSKQMLLGQATGKKLAQVLTALSLDYYQLDKETYVLVEKKSSLLSSSLLQQEAVTGIVTDASSGETLPGVNVMVKGTTTGTSTDSEGNYELDAPSLQDTLIFSFVGYQTREVSIAGRTEVNVEMITKLVKGEEITVVAYGEQVNKELTQSVSSVQGDEILKTSTPNVANALIGKVSGLQTFQLTGQPGSDSPQIFIRGVGSLSEGRSQPLIIVDGVERETFAHLDPNNIENISVLKDAAATAVYGIRGANGVIVVTTKRGQAGRTKVSAKFSSAVQKPTTKREFVDSHTYALRYNEAQRNDGVLSDQVRFSPEVIEAFRTNSNPTIFSNTDWVDYLMKPVAYQSQGNINISGGTEQTRYFVSGGFLSQDGLFKTFNLDNKFNPSFERYNFRANLDINATPTTLISLASGGRIESRVRLRTNQPNDNTLWRRIYRSVPFAGPTIRDGMFIEPASRYIAGPKTNALSTYYGEGYNQSTRNVLNLDGSISQELNFITKGLTFEVKGTYNTYYTQNKYRSSSQPIHIAYYRTDIAPSAVGDSTIVYQKIGNEGTLGYTENYSKDRDWYIEANIKYQQDFGRHKVGGLLLYNQQRKYYQQPYPGIPQGLVGMVGRLNYNYDDRYLLELNMGYNGSENFAIDNRFGFFPSFSGGWIVTNEQFMKKISFLDFLKIRASYGEVGNDRGIGRFLYLPNSWNPSSGGYNFGTNVPQNHTAANEGRIGNPNVQWETAKKQNYGIDIEFLNNRLSLAFDYFYELRENILTTRNTVPGYISVDLPAVNIGKVENHGYEAEAKWQQLIGESFAYHINANVSFARNKILFMDEVPPPEPYQSRTGNSVGQTFGYVFDGFATESDLMEGSGLPEYNYTLKPGDLKYKDLNKDGRINSLDQRPIGFPRYPEYTFGADLGFRYKNVDLTLNWVGATNVSRELFLSPLRTPFGSDGDISMMKWQAEGRWTPDNTEDATYPRLSLAAQTRRSQMTSDFWMRDASYIRLKNAEIGYNFSNQTLSKFGVRNLRIYLNGYNLLTFSKLKIADPEESLNLASGGPGRNFPGSKYPVLKMYNMGLKIDF